MLYVGSEQNVGAMAAAPEIGASGGGSGSGGGGGGGGGGGASDIGRGEVSPSAAVTTSAGSGGSGSGSAEAAAPKSSNKRKSPCTKKTGSKSWTVDEFRAMINSKCDESKIAVPAAVYQCTTIEEFVTACWPLPTGAEFFVECMGLSRQLVNSMTKHWNTSCSPQLQQLARQKFNFTKPGREWDAGGLPNQLRIAHFLGLPADVVGACVQLTHGNSGKKKPKPNLPPSSQQPVVAYVPPIPEMSSVPVPLPVPAPAATHIFGPAAPAPAGGVVSYGEAIHRLEVRVTDLENRLSHLAAAVGTGSVVGSGGGSDPHFSPFLQSPPPVGGYEAGWAGAGTGTGTGGDGNGNGGGGGIGPVQTPILLPATPAILPTDDS